MIIMEYCIDFLKIFRYPLSIHKTNEELFHAKTHLYSNTAH